MRYDKQNRRLESLKKEIESLRLENNRLKVEVENTKEILESTLHEVRRFSAQLSRFSERLSRESDGTPFNAHAQSVFYTAGMISSRLAYTDIELNPRALENQTAVRSGIYKKFDKSNRILAEEARSRGVNVQLSGESRNEIDALPVFELLPFVLLDNAIKYSPKNQSVTVLFEEVGGHQLVRISNTGPTVSEEEIQYLLDKKFRGTQTKKLPGEGLGLYLAKRVCEIHGVDIRVETGKRDLYQMEGISYSEFNIVLQF